MAVEDILEALAARQALESTPKPWLDAARGVISTDEAARQVEGDEDPALIERSKRLFRPGDPAVDEQRLQMLLEQGFATPSRAWWRGTVAIGLALAAALVLVVAAPWQRGSLPSYELQLEGTASLERGQPSPTAAGVARYYADRRFRATLRPWTEVPGAVRAAVYLCTEDGPRPLPLEPRVEPNGRVDMESDVAALGLPMGEGELLFVVGTADVLPQPTTCDGPEPSDDVRVLRTRIEILPPPR